MSFPFFGFILSSGIWHWFSSCWKWGKETPPKRFLQFWYRDLQTFKGIRVCWKNRAFKCLRPYSSHPCLPHHSQYHSSLPFGFGFDFVGEGMVEGINEELHSPAQAVRRLIFSLQCLIFPFKNPCQWELTGRALTWDWPWKVLSTIFHHSLGWYCMGHCTCMHLTFLFCYKTGNSTNICHNIL